jgi:hypothetical protein
MFLSYGLLKMILISREGPAKKDVYDGINVQFAFDNPSLWTIFGPRNDIRPIGKLTRLQFRIICRWFTPPATSRPKVGWGGHVTAAEMRRNYVKAIREYGSLFRLKHWLAGRWLSQMKAEPKNILSMAENGEKPSSGLPGIQVIAASGTTDSTGHTTSVDRPTFRLTPSYLRRHKHHSSAESSQSPGSSRPQLDSAMPSEAMVEEEDAEDVVRAKEAKEDAARASSLAGNKQNGNTSSDDMISIGTAIAMGEISASGSSSGSGHSAAGLAVASNIATDAQIQQVAAAAALLLKEKGVASGGFRNRMDSRIGGHEPRMRSESRFWGGDGPLPKLQRSRGLLDVPSSRTAWSSI